VQPCHRAAWSRAGTQSPSQRPRPRPSRGPFPRGNCRGSHEVTRFAPCEQGRTLGRSMVMPAWRRRDGRAHSGGCTGADGAGSVGLGDRPTRVARLRDPRRTARLRLAARQRFMLTPRIEALTMLAALASVTVHAKLGTGALLPFLRRPVQRAQTLASIDRLSGGRLAVALGEGSPVASASPCAACRRRRGSGDSQGLARHH
jgi:hypothetical protein